MQAPCKRQKRVQFLHGAPSLGLKVFTDAHDTVTVEEGDRYPLRPPSYGEAGATASVIHQILGY